VIRLPGLLTRGHLISDWYFIAHYLPWAPATDRQARVKLRNAKTVEPILPVGEGHQSRAECISQRALGLPRHVNTSSLLLNSKCPSMTTQPGSTGPPKDRSSNRGSFFESRSLRTIPAFDKAIQNHPPRRELSATR
jgi:hypothetical protein